LLVKKEFAKEIEAFLEYWKCDYLVKKLLVEM
jgi:hypothetical protein